MSGFYRNALAGALIGLCGCHAISSRLGLDDDEATDTTTQPRLDVGAETDDAEPKQKRKRRKAKPKKEPKPLPPPEAELDAALARAIIPVPDEPGLYRVDPFVLTLVADTLGREGDVPFIRTTKKQRRDGMPASFQVGELPKPSLWRLLGLRPGDLVLELQGAKPPGPKRLLELRQRIPREGTLSLAIQRNGRTKTLRYRIEPGLAWTQYLEVEANRSFDPPPNERPSGRSSSGASSRGAKPSPSKPSGDSKPVAVPVTCARGTCRVPKWYFDSLAGSSSKASRQMRGKSISSGFKISFVGPASRKAGFAVGEVITKVNGSRTNNQLAMLGVYGRLKSTEKFRVESTRGGRNRVTTIIVE